MTMWEGVDLVQRWFVWEHQSLSIGMRGYWSRIDCHAELFRRVEEISSVVEVVIWWGNKGECWEHFEGLFQDFCREGPTNTNLNPNAVQTFTEMSDFFQQKVQKQTGRMIRNPKLKHFLKYPTLEQRNDQPGTFRTARCKREELKRPNYQ